MRCPRAAWHAAALAVLSAAVPADARAQSDCPSGNQAAKGLVLTAPSGRRAELTWLPGGSVRIAETHASAPRSFPRETIASRGLIGTDLAWPGSKVQLKFDAPLDGLFPLVVGRQHELSYVAHRAGQPPLKGLLTLAVVEALRHAIGKCEYDAVLVASISAFEDGTQTPMRYDVYVPALQSVVKSTMFDSARNMVLEQESFEFEDIKPR